MVGGAFEEEWYDGNVKYERARARRIVDGRELACECVEVDGMGGAASGIFGEDKGDMRKIVLVMLVIEGVRLLSPLLPPCACAVLRRGNSRRFSSLGESGGEGHGVFDTQLG